MILEAFSEVLKREYARTGEPAKMILHRWLTHFFHERTEPSQVNNVIRRELAMVSMHHQTCFVSRSHSGEVLLNSLYRYCESYERWQFSRWLHAAQPHSFHGQG